MLYQQGDVLLKNSDIDLKGAKPVSPKNDRFIIAEGEVSGHAHAILDDVELFEKNGRLFIHANRPFAIVHEEHKDVMIPNGIWVVEKVREYDHFAEVTKKVVD
jgi:hypothetical protein